MQSIINRNVYFFCLVIVVIVQLSFSIALADENVDLSLNGCVKYELELSLSDLNSFQSIQVQRNEITSDLDFRGVFNYKMVPLKNILKLAEVSKKDSEFNKPVDLALLVRNANNKKVALSWGEVFFKDSAQVGVAYASEPILPHKDCSSCHKPEKFKPRLEQYQRKIGFPKLILTQDHHSDRCLENITDINVIDLEPEIKSQEVEKLYSEKFLVTDQNGYKLSSTELEIDNMPKRTVHINQVGEGKGYHGSNSYTGPSLRSILNHTGLEYDLNTVFLVASPDGYRSVLSYWEVFHTPAGKRIILAVEKNKKSLKESGKYFLILPEDLMADRWVKAVSEIQILDL